MRKIILLMLMALLPTVWAFPLTGCNDAVSATVYGVTEARTPNGDGTIYFIDMSASENDSYSIALIDSEDIAHGDSQTAYGLPNFREDDTSKYDITHIFNGSFRDTLQIPVPDGTIIKRLKISPSTSEPFSIDWDGVPEISAQNILLQFYSGKSEPSGGGKITWLFDLKVINLGNDTVSLPSFYMIDATGWAYGGINPNDRLLPGEALRFVVTFQDAGAASRPSQLVFEAGGADTMMDISAWI